MNHAIVSSNYSHSMSDLLKNHALLKALPADFVLQSSAQRGLMIDPNLTADKLLPLIKGWKPIVVFDSTIYFKAKKMILSASFVPGRIDVHVYSAGLDAEAIAEKIIKPFEKFKFENKEENGVWVNFSYAGSMGGVERNTQFLRCPTWDEIRENYAPSCLGELDRLMKMKKPWNSGRLMIWHGEPGTGKTFAIRALLMAWRDRFNFVIVTDPEKLMAFLPTFNEKIEEIDPAVIRPGRCISRLEFQKFTTEEAQDWLVKNKLGDLEPSGADTLEAVTLAELYQIKAKAKKQVPVTV